MSQRPVHLNYERDLPLNPARIAGFAIPLALEIIYGREPEEKAMPGCEGGAYNLPTREAHNG
jgi:hypothetical protein